MTALVSELIRSAFSSRKFPRVVGRIVSAQRGGPLRIQVDKGPEFVSKALNR
jgi:hypothetical protein